MGANPACIGQNTCPTLERDGPTAANRERFTVKVPARRISAAPLVTSTALTLCQPAAARSWQESGSEDDITKQVEVLRRVQGAMRGQIAF